MRHPTGCMRDIFEFDDALREEGHFLLAGVDEAGRGPIAGPVVASAVVLRDRERIRGLKDSKKLSARQIEILFWELLSRAVSIGVGIIDAREIDRVNILNATKKAMTLAILDLYPEPDLVVIDAVALDACAIPLRSFIKGEERSASIAAASVVAKFVRDSIMTRYHSEYPRYGFDRHKGYATELHMQRLRQFGPCEIHRTSFSPVSNPDLFSREG